MPRIIEYPIEQLSGVQKISGFLKAKGYSEQNLVNLKKDSDSIRLNGVCVHQNRILTEGDVLHVCIREQENSEQILPVPLPVSIVYEDEDLMVINKPAGMPIHPSRNNPDNAHRRAGRHLGCAGVAVSGAGRALCVSVYQQAGPGHLRAYNRGKAHGKCSHLRPYGSAKSG